MGLTQQSVALPAVNAYSALISLLGVNFDKPVTFGFSVACTASDTFKVFGTLDSAAVDDSNADELFDIAGFTGTPLPKNFADALRGYAYVFVKRVAGNNAGNFFVSGETATPVLAVSIAAPASGAFTTTLDLTSFGADPVRIMGSASQTASDTFEVYVTQDSAAANAAGCLLACSNLTGGGNDNGKVNSVIVQGFPYAIIKRTSTVATAGTIIACGVAASSGGGGGNFSAALLLGNLATGGVLGAAPATVDQYLAINLNQTTANQTVWPPDPTITTADHFLEFGNVGAVAVTLATSAAATKSRSVQPNDKGRLVWLGVGEGWAFDGSLCNGGNATGADQVYGPTDAHSLILRAGNKLGVSCTSNGDFTAGEAAGTSFCRLRAGSAGCIVDVPTATNGLSLEIQGVGGAFRPSTMNLAEFAALAGGAPPKGATAFVSNQDTTGQLAVNVGTPANPAVAVIGEQHGRATLVGGTTALIPAHVSATSTITPSIETPVPGAGNLTNNYAALGVDRVVGENGAGGGFKLTALLADGTINVLDTSVLGWTITG